MSTVLATLDDTATRIRYREPYLSDALNKKYQSIVAPGIYEGFTPETSGVQSIVLQPGDIGHAAVVQSDLDNTVQVSVHLTGAQLLDLSSEAGNTVILTLEANYIYPEATTAYIKMYQDGDPLPTNAVVICKVAVPLAAIAIPAASIALTGRTLPWDTRQRDAIPFVSLVKNDNFAFISEASPSAGVAPPYWNVSSGTVGTFRASTSQGPSGYGGYVVGRTVNVGAPAQTAKFYQRYSAPLTSNNRIRFGVAYQPKKLPTTVGSYPTLTVTLADPDTGATVQTLSISLDATTLDTWAVYEETLTATAVTSPSAGVYVSELAVNFNSLEYGFVDDVFYVTDFVLEVEQTDKATDIVPLLGGDVRANSLTLSDASYAINKGVVLSHSASTDLLSLSAAPGVSGTPGLYVPGTLTVGGSVIGDLTLTGDLYVNGGDIQRSTAGTLNVGTNSTNITTLTLGVDAATKTTTVQGATVNVGASATSALNLGATTANSATVTVGSASATGTTTTVNGVTVGVGGSTTATLNLGAASTSSAGINLGNAPTGGSVTTTIQGNTLSVGTDADTATINIGTTTTNSAAIALGNSPASGTVTTAVQGNTLNIGTASNVGNVNISTGTPAASRTLTLGINNASQTLSAFGGSISVGGSTTTALNLGQTTANSATITIGSSSATGTTTNVYGVTVAVGTSTMSTLNLGSSTANSATITIGSTTATGTNTTINGVTIAAGASTTATLSLGASSTSNAAITLGNAPTGGTVATSIQGNTLGVGTDADTATINVGTTTTSSAAITLGNAPVAGTVATGVAGNAISIGVSANTTSLTIGNGTSGVVRVARYLDGNTGTLSLGTDTTRSTAVEVGNTSANLTLAGAAITLGTAVATTSVTIGDGASGTVRIAQYLDGNSGALSLGTNATYSTSVAIGNTGTALTVEGTTVGIGTTSPSGTVTLSRTGQTTALAGNATVAGTTTATGAINANGGIERSTSGTLTIGSTSSTTNISIGTSNTTGGVTISRSGETTYVAGKLGVGASSPSQTFHLNVGTNNTAIYAQVTNGTTGAAAGDGLLVGLNASNEAVLNMQDSYAMRFYTAGTECLRILSTGYVGIGTENSPSTTLDVKGAHVTAKGLARLTSSSSIAALTFYPLGNYAGAIYGDTDNSLRLGTDGANSVVIYTNSTTNPRLTVSGAGNVTINAPASGDALTVNGPAVVDTAAIKIWNGSDTLSTGIGYGTLFNQSGTTKRAVAVGYNALTLMTTATDCTAVGHNAAYSVTGNNNTAFGSAALSNGTSGTGNTAVGKGALANAVGATNSNNVGFGLSALSSGGIECVGVGALAGFNLVTGSQKNVLIGYSAMYGALSGPSSLTSYNTVVGHTAAYSATTSSGVTAVGYQTAYSNTSGSGLTAVGYQALYSSTTANYGTAVGYRAAYNSTGSNNTALGYKALYANTSSSFNTAIGDQALAASTGASNTAVGYAALILNTSGTQNTAIGDTALGNLGTYSNCSGLGYNAQVTGDNQVQLGDSATTSYAYGVVQNRSDARDKADIRDTALGLNFVTKLRPVDFRWDYREDYVEQVPTTTTYVDESGVEQQRVELKTVEHLKDGSKKRARFHHGFIAQEVKEVMNSLDTDFGGYQDHSVKGGKDVLSIGYAELIAPLVKAVQQLAAENADLRARLDALEGKQTL